MALAGASTIVMAQAFPKSTFFGFDSHAASVKTAAERPAEAGLGRQANLPSKRATKGARGWPAAGPQRPAGGAGAGAGAVTI